MKDATTHDAVKPSSVTSEWTPLHAARLQVCRLLALVASDPRSARWQRLGQEEFIETARAAAAFLSQEAGAMPQQLAPGERTPADLDLTPLAEALDAPHDDLVEEYDRVFGYRNAVRRDGKRIIEAAADISRPHCLERPSLVVAGERQRPQRRQQ